MGHTGDTPHHGMIMASQQSDKGLLALMTLGVLGYYKLTYALKLSPAEIAQANEYFNKKKMVQV